tara:strand:- start:54 stop:497 length:444 start_codon:yes stop_codon:yes gene_type:complete
MSFCGICGKKHANAEEQFAHMKEHTPEEILNYENEHRKRIEEMKEIHNREAQTNQPNLLFTRGPNFRKTYVTEWGISLTDLDIRIDLFNERVNHPPHPLLPNQIPPVEFIIENQIITPIVSAKTLYLRLGELINSYEINNGEIPVRM